MNEIHFYSSKIKSIILLIISFGFVYFFIYSYEELTYKSYFIIMMSHFVFILFCFGIIYSMILIFRRKPLLTINENEIIIFYPLRKKVLIPFEDIGGFFISSSSYRGIKTSHQINIVMKNVKLKKNKIVKTIFPQFENMQYAIQSDLLNVKTKKLIIILNSYLKNSNTNIVEK
ncbi:hypothetical protein SAMN05421846_11048 [Chryseobacterium taeanense]|uniref:Uncharacterized protein n=1 Tax=Chryseobacterium taeanense TaxID=311334 RepID=A0A1G8LUU1_9FLAO|nr:hypothetical protein SAMN05421846_11048 [Chryseobacterium taeanense]